MPQREVYLTEEGLKRLREELEYLRNVRRPQVAQRIQRASEVGGTVDNAEYDEAKNEQAFVEGRIQELDRLLANAVVVSGSQGSEVVQIGSSVTVVTEDGRQQRYVVVGSAEAAPSEGRISNESPVGKALLGHRVGDQVEVQTPSRVMKLTIVEIR